MEELLRHAPQPTPPPALKEKLLVQAQANSKPHPRESRTAVHHDQNWLRRWWLALVPAGLSMFCIVVLGVQQMEIRDLNRTLQKLSATIAGSSPSDRDDPLRNQTPRAFAPPDTASEMTRLQQTVRQLSDEVSRLEKLHDENLALKAELAQPPPALFAPEEIAALQEARERAMQIQCINHLKQLGLAARLWAGDNNDMYPPDVISMTNEMNTPRILYCPADAGRQQAQDWRSFTMANCSYEWFLNPPGSDSEPTRVLTRCPVHGSVGLYDGSVQSRVAKEHPDWFVQRGGKLYMEPPAQPTTNSGMPPQ